MLALSLMLGVALAACGGDEAEEGGGDALDTRPEPTERGAILAASPGIASPGASPVGGSPVATPARSGLTQDLESDRVSIQDGELDPDRVVAQVGIPFVLTVEGDGQPHTLAIEGLVTETQIAAQGETQVQLNVPEGSEGDHPILLDGEEAGTLAVEGAGGVPGAD
jgi:hypothetical protein